MLNYLQVEKHLLENILQLILKANNKQKDNNCKNFEIK